jgi:ribosomal protein L11 methyltransferase
MTPDGVLVLSGLLVSQADEVISHYAPSLGLQLDSELDGWACLVGRKN